MKLSWIRTLQAGVAVLVLSLALVVGGAALETARADDDDKQAEIDRLTLELAVATAERDALFAAYDELRAYTASLESERAAERDALFAALEFYEAEIARLHAALESAIADRHELMEALQEAENLQDYVAALVQRVAELEAGEHGATGTQTSLHNKWQRFLDGNPTLSLTEGQILALYNRWSRRATHDLFGAGYEVDAGVWTKGSWSEGISYKPVTGFQDTLDSWPQGWTGQPILEHNGVRLLNINIDQIVYDHDDRGDWRDIGDVYWASLEHSAFVIHEFLSCWGASVASCDESLLLASSSLDTYAGLFTHTTSTTSSGHHTGTSPTGLGSAMWTGVMTGLDLIRYEPGTTRLILGDVEIDIDDLSNPDVDVEFTGIRDVTRGTSRPDMVWNNLALTDGAFNDGADPTISGAFYGPAHQEVGGVFDRNRITGAFGASAVKNAEGTPTANAIAEVVTVPASQTNIGIVEAALSGSGHQMIVQTSPIRYAHAVPYRSAANALEFYTSHTSAALPLDPLVAWQGRSITTSEQAGSLGSTDQWQVFEGSKDYARGGTLAVLLATDADDGDTLGRPWVGYGETDRTIVLDDIPDLLPGHDWQGVRLPDDGLQGMLDGTPGTFTCEGGSWCYLELSQQTGYYPGGGSVVFTPDSPGGAEVALPSTTQSAAVPTANYLSFGYWLYEPDSPTVFDPVDFGVLAGGGDPFEPSRVQGLTGTATYAGDAIGMYYTNALSNSAAVGSFEADVELTADFGTSLDDGTLEGRIHGFTSARGAASFPTELRFETTPITEFAPIVGGVSGGPSDAPWGGEWGAAFFGNGVTLSAHPAGVAGTFGATDGGSGIAGSFGAHKQ